MADVIDRAAKYTEKEMAFHLGEIRAASRDRAKESRAECEDCGNPIPEGRRRAMPGCTRCIECQELFEKKTDCARSGK